MSMLEGEDDLQAIVVADEDLEVEGLEGQMLTVDRRSGAAGCTTSLVGCGG